jgi:type VI secretion system protein ImpK
MSVERSSALSLSEFITHLPVQAQLGYYRSKLFSVTSTSNPMLAAASPLFSLLERFTATQSLPSIESIRENIEHEWNAFRSRLTSLKYTGELAMVAEYLVSATVDELLGKTYLRLHAEPAQFIAFTPSSLDSIGPEKRFFELVYSMKERTNQYLDLLELAYYCLISGFEGELHLRVDGRQTLDNLIQELYELIVQHRAHKPVRLFKETHQPPQEPAPSTHLAFWKPALLGFSALIVLFVGAQSVLNHKANTLYIEQAQRINQDY